MRKRSVVAISSVVGLIVGLGVGVVSATTNPSQDSDSGPPTLTTFPWADFPLGAVVTTDAADPSDATNPRFSHVDRRVSWSASDPSGVCTSALNVLNINGQNWGTIASGPDLRTSLVGSGDYNGAFGGEQTITPWWRVRVEDCILGTGLNNGAYALVRGGTPAFTQDDGRELGTNDPPVTITYAGSWAVSTCQCWSGDTTRKTSTAGSSATISGTFARGERVALVMAKAPDRGQFDVYVDGTKNATVDLFSSSGINRVVVWRTAMSSAGTHTVKIVSLGTPGRPRIDLDVVITH